MQRAAQPEVDTIWTPALEGLPMKTAFDIVAKPAKKPAAKKNAFKPPSIKRGSKRTEQFIDAVMGLKFR